jgi:acyl-CoA synthetase (AMP-forming)/AMP-acid ligase II
VSGFASLVDLLDARAQDQRDETAFSFLNASGHPAANLTYGMLRAKAGHIAQTLCARGARAGDRAILVFPPGLDFIVAFFGCLAAGVIAVPLAPPRRIAGRDAVESVIADCDPRFGLTTATYAADLAGRRASGPAHKQLDWVYVGDEAHNRAEQSVMVRPDRSDLAFLQYTSGSTSAPKGVMVSHGNLLENLEMIRRALGHSRSSKHVCWMPLHHDMGLILNVLEAFYLGTGCALMAPVAFLQRPLTLLKAIGEFGAEVAGGPNFGFDLCVTRFRAEEMRGIDLSCWRVAINGAEPVRAQTLHKFAATFEPFGFRPSAFNPCYGMAEATLLISGGQRGAGPVIRTVDRSALQGGRIAPAVQELDEVAIVGCGKALDGEQIAIVDPGTRRRLAADCVGEIWVGGPHVAGGYWRNRAASNETFAGQIASEEGAGWMRTGDLGFMDLDGELFVTGRIKDVIIVRGANHYPQDIEYTVQATDPCLRAGYGAAFAALAASGDERVVIVQEVERSHRARIDAAEIADRIREAVVEEHGLGVLDVVLLEPGTIPKTTSGKIRRRMAKNLWESGELASMAVTKRRPPSRNKPIQL